MMANAVVATSPADQFRAKAAGVLSDASEMSLHGLLDEFVRLTNVMDENVAEDEDGDMGFTPAGELASRQRRLIVVAAQARFGISFEAHDRPSSSAWPI